MSKKKSNPPMSKDFIAINKNDEVYKLAKSIVTEISNAKTAILANINQTMVQTYWSIGRHIVEFQQKGNAKAKYGSSLLTQLSKILTLQIGRGYSRPNLNNMRKFYLLYPICQTSDKLTWSHICELIKIDDSLERDFYEKECVNANWDVRSLRRQMDSGLFLRLASTKDKKGILKLAKHGVETKTPQDVIKDTYYL